MSQVREAEAKAGLGAKDTLANLSDLEEAETPEAMVYSVLSNDISDTGRQDRSVERIPPPPSSLTLSHPNFLSPHHHRSVLIVGGNLEGGGLLFPWMAWFTAATAWVVLVCVGQAGKHKETAPCGHFHVMVCGLATCSPANSFTVRGRSALWT